MIIVGLGGRQRLGLVNVEVGFGKRRGWVYQDWSERKRLIYGSATIVSEARNNMMICPMYFQSLTQ